MEKICCRCKLSKPTSEFGKHLSRKDGLYFICKICHNINNKVQRLLYKENAFKEYGGCICKCCGITQSVFLSIDHIDNNGNQHRKEIQNKGGYHFYTWLKKNNYPPGYQVLCMNCNFGKRMNNGICPHKSKKGE